MKDILDKTFFLILIAYFFSSCEKLDTNKDGGQDEQISYLTGYNLENSYYTQYISLALSQFAGVYDGLDGIGENVEYGVDVYSISYNTTFKGEQQAASGLVCLPSGDGPFPVMSFQNGTNTLNSNAPSVAPNYQFYILLEMIASTGFAVVIPDYLGFGASSDMFHPYLDKESTNQTVLDMIRAAKELADSLDTELSSELYIAGYSQGGWATMQLQKEIESNHPDEFDLKASSCGAGPYDLGYINKYITEQTTYTMPYFFGYIFDSYTKLGDMTTSVSDVFNEPYASKILSLYDGTKSGSAINSELSTNVASLLTADYISNYGTGEKYASLKSTLQDNSISAWATTTPTLLGHSMSDELIPYEVSNNIYQDFLALGVGSSQVLFTPISGTGHSGGAFPFGIATINWFLELMGE